jgi:hypothetical protein
LRGDYWVIYVNGSSVRAWAHNTGGNANVTAYLTVRLKRGDYVQVGGGHYLTSTTWSDFYIVRQGE